MRIGGGGCFRAVMVVMMTSCGGAQAAVAQAFHNEAIMDPALQMKAYDVGIPNGWKYQGTLMPGDSCDDTPSPVYRAYSPDGLSEFRRLPRFDWSWGNAPYATPVGSDCLPLKHDISAADFVKSQAKLMGATVIGPLAEDPRFANDFLLAIEQSNQAIMAQMGQRPFRGDFASVRLEFTNGSFTIEEQMRVVIQCAHTNLPGFSGGTQFFKETCGANVRVLRAPKGKLDALVQMVNNVRTSGAQINPVWSNAYTEARQKVVNRIVGENRERMQRQQVQFDEAQRVRAQQNQQYQASLQAGYAAHNAQAAQIQGMYADHNGKVMANMDARHTPASDWVDYALDQQTVSGTGGTAVKVPSGYSQVWANQSGQYYMTNNLNVNPNGSMPGEWTQQTQVHGNGQSY